MTVRDATPADYDEIAQLHICAGSKYPLPGFGDGTFLAVLVGEEDGKIVTACACRRVAEAFLIPRQQWATPAQRLDALNRIHAAMLQRLRELDVKDAHALLPDNVARPFARRLKALGWWRPTWPLWARRVL